jgi:hypothetical protein
VLKTLYNVISVTIETTNPDVSTTTSNIQAMDSIMIDNFESIYKEVRNYIRVLLNTVAYIQHKLEQKSMEAFNIAISLLKCVSKALNPIFSAALDILIYSFEDADFIDQFKSTPSELKILFLMMEAHSTESTHNKIFKLITILLDNDLSTLLSDHPVIILMTLIPFFWTQRFDASVQSALTKAANLCGEKTLVDELEGLRIHVAKDLVYRISNASLTTLVNHPGLPLLIQYYTQITEENHATIEIVLLIAERLMQHPKLEYSTLQLFAWIGRFATAPNPGTYLNPALEFIFKFAEKNGKIANEPFNMRHNTKFPQIKIDLSSDPRTWEPDPNVDPFLAPADFPPMGVQISSFTETEFQERICTHLLQLKIQPLAMWEEMTDSAIGHIPVMSSESASLQMPPKALLANTINTILNIADKPTVAFETLKKHETSRYSTHASRSRGSAEVRKPVEEKVVTTFDFSVFGPDDPSTTTIGNDLLTGIILFA